MATDLAVNIGPYIAPLLVVAIVARRLIKNPPRKVKPSRLFITPGLLAVAAAFTLKQTGVPSLLWLLVDVVAVGAGAGVGYLTARHREFTLDAETGEIMGRSTPIGTIIFAALFAVRFGLMGIPPDKWRTGLWPGGREPSSCRQRHRLGRRGPGVLNRPAAGDGCHHMASYSPSHRGAAGTQTAHCRKKARQHYRFLTFRRLSLREIVNRTALDC
jgi:hypothetical protein